VFANLVDSVCRHPDTDSHGGHQPTHTAHDADTPAAAVSAADARARIFARLTADAHAWVQQQPAGTAPRSWSLPPCDAWLVPERGAEKQKQQPLSSSDGAVAASAVEASSRPLTVSYADAVLLFLSLTRFLVANLAAGARAGAAQHGMQTLRFESVRMAGEAAARNPILAHLVCAFFDVPLERVCIESDPGSGVSGGGAAADALHADAALGAAMLASAALQARTPGTSM
jgi:hypothetical protein